MRRFYAECRKNFQYTEKKKKSGAPPGISVEEDQDRNDLQTADDHAHGQDERGQPGEDTVVSHGAPPAPGRAPRCRYRRRLR